VATTTEAGFVLVWGGDLGGVQRCEVDRFGNFCGGPEISDQAEIEDALGRGEAAGETAGGHRWERV
jgi:hypothetical protein